MNREIGEKREKKGLGAVLKPVADLVCEVNRLLLAKPSLFACFVFFAVPTAFSGIKDARAA